MHTVAKIAGVSLVFLGSTYLFNTVVPWEFVKENSEFDYASSTQKVSLTGWHWWALDRKKTISVRTKLFVFGNQTKSAKQLDKNMKYVVKHPVVGALWWRMVYYGSLKYEISKNE